MQEAIEAGSRAVASGAFAPTDLQPASSEIPLDPNPAERYSQEAVPRDYRTGILTVGVLALAVFLGWMVGRVGWSMAVNRAPIQIPLASEEPPATAGRDPVKLREFHHGRKNRRLLLLRLYPVPNPGSIQARCQDEARSSQADGATRRLGGIRTWQGGLPYAPGESEAPAKAAASVVEPGTIQKAATREDDAPAPTAPGTPPLGNGYLLERVEPQYPEAAKQQHIQGPVMLHALVGADGSVKELS